MDLVDRWQADDLWEVDLVDSWEADDLWEVDLVVLWDPGLVGLDFVTTIVSLITIVLLTTIGSLTTVSLTTIGFSFIIRTVSFSVLISFRLASLGGTPGIPGTPLYYGYYPPYYGYYPYYGYSYDSPYSGGGQAFDYQYWTNLALSVQSELTRRGHYHGPTDGVIGSDSSEAIRAFQAAQGLPVTGRIDTKLLRALGIRYRSA